MFTTRVLKIKYCTVIDAYNLILYRCTQNVPKCQTKNPHNHAFSMRRCTNVSSLQFFGQQLAISSSFLTYCSPTILCHRWPFSIIEVAKRDSFSQHWMLNLTVPLGSVVIGMPQCNGVGSHGSENIDCFSRTRSIRISGIAFPLFCTQRSWDNT